MFNANDALRYPGFFTRTWTPAALMAFLSGMHEVDVRVVPPFAHANAPPLTPRLATPIGVEGPCSDRQRLERLGLSQALPEDVAWQPCACGYGLARNPTSHHTSAPSTSVARVGSRPRMPAVMVGRICHRGREWICRSS
ncbi:hypothetical protein TcBrA4_0101030 [Trypanosoma cruzi]|nr:hypothetical protein TcBrA4_0101030 [Trypanosoma cruzi]